MRGLVILCNSEFALSYNWPTSNLFIDTSKFSIANSWRNPLSKTKCLPLKTATPTYATGMPLGCLDVNPGDVTELRDILQTFLYRWLLLLNCSGIYNIKDIAGTYDQRGGV